MIGALGDLDGDGHDDLGWAGWDGAGAVEHVQAGVLAGTDATGVLDVRDGATWEVTSPTGGNAESAPVGPGDLDGDGGPDVVLVGTSEHSTGRRIAALDGDVVAAGPASVSELDALLAEVPIPVGRDLDALVAVGDVDGDGLGDLALIGSVGRDRDGAATPVAGEVAVLTAAELPHATDPFAGATIVSAGRGRFGEAHVSPAGDVDGDGLADLLVGFGTWDDSDDLPSAELGWVSGATLSDGELVLASVGGLGTVPWNIAGGCDLTGDGVPDLVALQGFDRGRPWGAHVWSGADPVEPWATVILPDVEEGLACVPDLDGDGRDELALGAQDFTVPL